MVWSDCYTQEEGPVGKVDVVDILSFDDTTVLSMLHLRLWNQDGQDLNVIMLRRLVRE
jgi:hypothetical protein